ncbi:hypothetical protein [Nocardia inohanensis]|uniref:hypothetical protein n=1 Tax=Nocardia inohanensis TaxID=209246 RepID=UPI0008343262|nr:hypothetical protein [Nocardia inohanensis]
MTDTQNTVYDDDIMITMRGVSDSIGLPYTVNPIELIDRQALIELREGPPGPPGPDGDAAWPWLWQGDIASPAALAALNLTIADARKAWRVVSENAIYYWTGLELVGLSDAFRAAGRKGAPNALTGTAVAGAPGSAASARVVGTSPGQQLEITFPRGETGDPGDPGGPGRIQDAGDVQIDDAHPLGQDYVLAWNSAAGKFQPRPSPRVSGPWAIAAGQFTGVSNTSEAKRVVATITIPAQPVKWRPVVEGGLIVQTHTATLEATRCDIEVRLGSPDGELVGYGYAHGAANVIREQISPKFEHPVSPDSTVGVVPENRTVTLYVIVRRVVGSAGYTVITQGAQLIVYAQPV